MAFTEKYLVIAIDKEYGNFKETGLNWGANTNALKLG